MIPTLPTRLLQLAWKYGRRLVDWLYRNLSYVLRLIRDGYSYDYIIRVGRRALGI